MNTKNHFIKQNTIYGFLVGGSFITASLLFFITGKNIVLDSRINNIIMILSIVGIFLGIHHFRDKYLNGFITYGKALLTGLYILGVASFLYAVYTFILYSLNPELMEQFKEIVLLVFKQSYGSSPLYSTVENNLTHYFYPLGVALGEFFNKVFFGSIYTLLLAGLSRRNEEKQPV